MKARNVFYLLCISKLTLLILYCVFHTILSSNSIFKVKLLEQEIKKKNEILVSLEKRIVKSKNKVLLISDPNYLDLDFLDEEARKKIGLKTKQ